MNNTMTMERRPDGTIIQTFHVNNSMSINDIKNTVKNAITLEFFVNFGKNYIIEFDNVTLTTSEIVSAIDMIRSLPAPIRRKLPRIIESSEQIYELTQMQYIYEYLS